MDGALDSKLSPRISIRDGQFRCVVDGKQEDMGSESYINMVVINAANIVYPEWMKENEGTQIVEDPEPKH